ncbi:sensor histidine kinase [Actinophytocola sp. NPDC049390]|uniref:sensor histidine kinase n=1 Tax=Actinophytocola sp. NPDC049390 TaxID=3363894 RepID=UPI00379BE1D8
MDRFGPDDWSGVAMLVVCVGVGVPVILGATEPAVPHAVWLAGFAAVIAAAVGSVFTERPAARYVLYGLAVVVSWGLVVTAPGAGLLPILLVALAALGAELVTVPVALAVTGANTAIVAVTAARQGGGAVDVLTVGGFYALIQLATVLSVAASLRERRARRELAAANVELRAAGVLLEESARTAERLRISRELHDLIGHQLTVLALELEAARHRADGRAREHVERAGTVARELLADVRATVDTLRTDHATDLAEALRRVGRQVPGLAVTVEIDDAVGADEEQTAVLVRAMQEIVTNTLRHGHAATLRVEVARDGDRIRMTAVDDGRGTREVRVGNGLRGLSERVAALGGDVSFDGAASFDGTAGFRVTATVPVR